MTIVTVLIVGGGVAGLFTAIGLASSGVDVALVEAEQPGHGQSGACHGYLHRGFAYGPREAGLSEQLQLAQEYWKPVVANIEPVTSSSTVLFRSAAEAEAGRRRWSSQGLAAERVPTPDWSAEPMRHCFRTDEPTYDTALLLNVLEAAVRELGVRIVTGLRAVGFRSTAEGVAVEFEPTGVAVLPDLPVLWEAVVLAAGQGLHRLVGTEPTSPVGVRSSHMLVLGGDLPQVSAVFPEQDRHGLFLASRADTVRRRTTWLLSTFHSFDPASATSDELFQWWARHVLTTLAFVVDEGVFAAIDQIGGYRATKSGLRPATGTVALSGSYVLPGQRVVVAAPSKLTLAPVAAEETVGRVLDMLRPHQVREPLAVLAGLNKVGCAPARTGVPLRGERWTTCPFGPFDPAAFLSGRTPVPAIPDPS